VFNSLSDHRFSHSMSTRELNIRFHLFDGFLDTFSCGLGRVRGHVSRASFVGPQFCSCDSFIGSSHVVPFRYSSHVSNDCTHSFPRVNTFRYVSKGDSRLYF
jgi:hypothetical protein